LQDLRGLQMSSRRFVVKMVTRGSPGWSGTLWAYGCKHLGSAEALFERRESDVGPGDGLLLIDREEKKILRARGSADPVRTANCLNRLAG
jgi:hypothetical protein